MDVRSIPRLCLPAEMAACSQIIMAWLLFAAVWCEQEAPAIIESYFDERLVGCSGGIGGELFFRARQTGWATDNHGACPLVWDITFRVLLDSLYTLSRLP